MSGFSHSVGGEWVSDQGDNKMFDNLHVKRLTSPRFQLIIGFSISISVKHGSAIGPCRSILTGEFTY